MIERISEHREYYRVEMDNGESYETTEETPEMIEFMKTADQWVDGWTGVTDYIKCYGAE